MRTHGSRRSTASSRSVTSSSSGSKARRSRGGSTTAARGSGSAPRTTPRTRVRATSASVARHDRPPRRLRRAHDGRDPATARPPDHDDDAPGRDHRSGLLPDPRRLGRNAALHPVDDRLRQPAAGSHAQLLDRRDLRDGDHPGSYSFTVEVTDSAAQTDTQALSIDARAPLQITTTSLPGGTAGQAYSASVQASGGKTPYSWSLAAGSLPPGLALSGTTGAVTGTPTSPGTYAFTVRADDSGTPGRSDTQALSIAIGAPPAPRSRRRPSRMRPPVRPTPRPSPPRAERRPTPSGRPSPAACRRVSRSTPRPARSPGRRPRPGATRSRSR